MKKVLLVCIAVLLLSTSCATITKEARSIIRIQSNVEGATVYVNGFERGMTPMALFLGNDQSYYIKVEKEGYESQSFIIKKKIRWGAQVADFFLFGGIGNLVDLVNPNGYKLKPSKIYVELEEK